MSLGGHKSQALNHCVVPMIINAERQTETERGKEAEGGGEHEDGKTG